MVNDDVLKLWEETEADNRRLLSEMTRVRSEIKETKYQMEKISSKVTVIPCNTKIFFKKKIIMKCLCN